MVIPALLLQKPSGNSKSKDFKQALERRFVWWQQGDLLKLLKESEFIQKRLKSSTPSKNIEAVSKKFSNLMKAGKINAAVKLLTANMDGGVLPLTEETMTLLQEKHPEPSELATEAVIDRTPEEIHPVVFDGVDEESVRKAAMSTKGGAGPSSMDADGWRHILLSRNFKEANKELRGELAICVKKLATEKVDIFYEKDHPTSNLEAYLACRLVPLDKSPGLRPIGVGEVLRRIIGKVFMSAVKDDVQEVCGSMQVCVGQAGGCEAAIHAMRQVFQDEETDALLLVDASNAFNSINRITMLENIKRLCPMAYVYAYNCYSVHARLFILGDMEMYSEDGTTQGDPPAMAFYGLGILPLLLLLKTADEEYLEEVPNENEQIQINVPQKKTKNKQAAFADDLNGGSKVKRMRAWFDLIQKHGPKYGFNLEASKCWIIVKPSMLEEAQIAFEGTEVKFTTSGKKLLGASVGSSDFKAEFVNDLLKKWILQIETLAEIALFNPHSAYVAFTSGIRHRYSYYMRTIPDISALLRPLENVIRSKLIPALTEGRSVTDDERLLLSLPPRLGGMGIISPPSISDLEHQLSILATSKLTSAITEQLVSLPTDFNEQVKEDKSEVKHIR